MAQYRKRSTTLEATLFDGTNWEEVGQFVGARVFRDLSNPDQVNRESITLRMPGDWTLDIARGDYIVRGSHGQYFICKPDIFELMYELA